jgi:hypothetical protein
MPRFNNCIFCQLQNLNPLHPVKCALFVGLLAKDTKIHEVEFEVPKPHPTANMEQHPRDTKSQSSPSLIEVRSLRLKDRNDEVSNFINLFPDACTVMINGRHIKEFTPLHRQSSLKYRRDECIRVTNSEVGVNKLVIT